MGELYQCARFPAKFVDDETRTASPNKLRIRLASGKVVHRDFNAVGDKVCLTALELMIDVVSMITALAGVRGENNMSQLLHGALFHLINLIEQKICFQVSPSCVSRSTFHNVPGGTVA